MAKEKPLTVKDVAEQCHVSKVSVLRWIRQGEIESYTTPGGHHRIRKEDFRKFAQRFKIPVDEAMLGPRAGQAIVVADDDPGVRDLVTTALKREVRGAAIHTATDGYEAFFLIGRVKPDLVVLDIKMPQLDGLEVCRKIRSNPELRDMRVFIITGFTKDFPREKILALGADACMEKPFDLLKFTEEVHRLLHLRKRP